MSARKANLKDHKLVANLLLLMSDEVDAAVIENDSGMIKAGPAGDETRRSIFQTVVGHTKHAALSLEGKDTFIGDHAYFKAGIITLKYRWWFHYRRQILGKSYHTQGVQ